jgi:hypothetical protein
MARTARTKHRQRNEEIHVSVFKDIRIHFPGDTYLLAIWVAMSDRAKSTPTCQQCTTLHGLASKFASLYGMDYSDPLNCDDVMAVFRSHGITGNPLLRLDTKGEQPSHVPLIEHAGMLCTEWQAASRRIAEPSHALEPAAESDSNGQSSPSTT